MATALELVRAGMGLTIVPKYGLPHDAPGLVTIPLSDPVTRVIGILQRMDGVSLRPARELMTHIAAALKGLSAPLPPTPPMGQPLSAPLAGAFGRSGNGNGLQS